MPADESPSPPEDSDWLDEHAKARFSPLEAWPPLAAPGQEREPLEPSRRSIDEILAGSDSMRVLRRVVHGDPLGLERVVREQLDRLAVMVHPARLLAATQARCAFRGAQGSVPSPEQLTEWTCRRLTEALESLTQEDWSAERLQLPADPLDERYLLAQGPYGLSSSQARRVALRFNQQSARLRRPLYAVLIKGRAMTQVAETFGLQLEVLKSMLFDCLSAFRSADDTPPDDFFDALLDEFEDDPPINPEDR